MSGLVTLDMKTAMTEVASSGEEDPAAMRVAPATSGVRQRASDTRVSEGTKKSSQTTVRPGKQNKMIFTSRFFFIWILVIIRLMIKISPSPYML